MWLLTAKEDVTDRQTGRSLDGKAHAEKPAQMTEITKEEHVNDDVMRPAGVV